jgi:hypothetical protein
LVGVGKDALDLDVIVHEFKKTASSGQEGEETPNGKEVELRAKHYLVFFFQLWDGKAAPVKFCCARFAMCSMDTFFIRNAVLDITSALAAYGLIVNTIAADRASENRSANKMLATVTAREAYKIN